MRDIKFRAFHKENKTMVYFDKKKYVTDQFQGAALLGLIAGDDSGYLMQFTGLSDKNGREIYEGDILKVPDDYDIYGFMAGEVRQVYFKDGCFRFKPKNDGESTERGHHLEDDYEYKVIGNIYENPELLAEK
jgi:uncharacterized phage protein (TIGR01671 family)